MSEKEQERNPHIDQSRSHENEYLVQEDLKELYEREFGGALEKYNAKQKRNDRKIKDYYKHVQSSKKTSLQQEMIIQIGDKDDFSSDENREIANEVLQDWFKDFEKRNPNLKVYNAVIHNDETSPHLHLNFVPVAGEYKNGLEKQVSFDRAIIQQDSEMQKERPFDQWREKEVRLLEEKLNEHGIGRKLVGKNNYKDVNDYKEKKDLEREVQLLDRKIVGKQKELIDVSEALPVGKLDIKVRPEIKTEVKQKLFGDAEIVKKETGNFVLTPKQLKELSGYVNAALAVKKDYDRLLSTALVKENEALKAASESFYQSYDKTRESRDELWRENKSLISSNNDLKARVADLTLEIKEIYRSVKEFVKEHGGSMRDFKSAIFVKEHTKGVRDFRSVFKDFVDKVKGKVLQARERAGLEPRVSEFEKIHEKEVKRERDNELSR